MKIAIKRLNVFPNIEVHFPLVQGIALFPIFASDCLLTKMESASCCKFLASFYKLTRKLDRRTVLHASVSKWFSAFQDSEDSRHHCYVSCFSNQSTSFDENY